MSPDWAAKPEAVPYSSLGDPQSLNLYGYVGNNPLSKADADGHCWPVCWAYTIGEGIARDGGLRPYLKNALTGGSKGAVSAALSTARLAGAAGNPFGTMAAVMAPTPKALQPSNTTEAQASFVTQVVLPAAVGMGSGGLAGGGASTESVLTGLANQAVDNLGPGSGSVYGTLVHSEFSDLVEGLGNPNLFTEQSYLNGNPVDYGTPGSIRIDVGEGTVDAPTNVYDLKTGGATLKPQRVGQIQSHLPNGSNVNVTQIKPQ